MTRPVHLPDFTNPPLDEVVLGVQFSPVPSYSSVDAKDVWSLFRADFPRVEEQLPLPPQFETFGGLNPQAGFQFQLSQLPPGTRQWFNSADGNQLIQFQPDRFLTNWRKLQGLQPYPRYESISEAFERNLAKLRAHLLTAKSYDLEINQAEIIYINIIPMAETLDVDKWVSFWQAPLAEIELINLQLTQVIRNENGHPEARLHHEVQTVASLDGKNKALRLNLIYRGKPRGSAIADAMEFLSRGREVIVTRFAEITTKHAQTVWGRK